MDNLVNSSKAGMMLGIGKLYFMQLARDCGIKPKQKVSQIIDDRFSNYKTFANLYALEDVKKVKEFWQSKKVKKTS